MTKGVRTTGKLLVMLGAAVAATVPVPPASAATTEAGIAGYAFAPGTVTIAVGDSVKWTNRDNDSHTVTADDGSFDSNGLTPQGTFTQTFNQAGTVAYHCAIHTGMKGTVQVGTASAPDGVAEDEGGSLVVPGIAALVVLGGGAGWLMLRRR